MKNNANRVLRWDKKEHTKYGPETVINKVVLSGNGKSRLSWIG